jgi:acetolactate synthase-1/2/3 large subunit
LGINLETFGRTGGARTLNPSQVIEGNRKMSADKKRVKGSDVLIATLEKLGVERIFGIPGEDILHIWDALESSKIELVLTRHEQGAGYMAAASGRLTGRAGVCIGTCSPGALNFFNAAAYALLGGMPLVMIGGAKPIKNSLHGGFQVTDIVPAMKFFTKSARQIASVPMIPTMIRDGFRVAEEDKPGSVYFEFPEDILAEECPDMEF